MKRQKSRTAVFAALAALAALLCLLFGPALWQPASAQAQSPAGPASPAAPGARELLRSLGNAISQAAEGAKPSVVNISTTTTVNMEQQPMGDLFDSPLFKKFFGDEPGRSEGLRKFKSAALGSGVIISSDGYILTNSHVVENADEITVTLSTKQEFKGKVIGADPPTEIAVIKIEAADLPAIKIGKSEDLKAGDVVIAIGNPFGLNQTITMGIVSAVGRVDLGIADYEDYIQTDAAVNPGNSGGALINYNGELVGINTAILSSLGGNIGIGFAIPTEMAYRVAQSIIKNGRVIRGRLGVSIQDLTPDLATTLDIKQERGALVTEVLGNTPAEKAGLKRGDLIVEFGGKPVESAGMLRNLVANTQPGASVPVRIIREGKSETLTATVGEFQAPKEAKQEEFNNALRGVQVQELTAEVRDRLEIPKEVRGVLVAGLRPESPAGRVLRRGDVIQEINRTPITGMKEYEGVVSKIGQGESVLLLLYRSGRYIYVTVK